MSNWIKLNMHGSTTYIDLSKVQKVVFVPPSGDLTSRVDLYFASDRHETITEVDAIAVILDAMGERTS